MQQKVIHAASATGFAEQLKKAIENKWFVKFMAVNDHAYFAVLEM